MIQDDSLNVPPPPQPPTDDPVAKEFEPIDSGSELEEDGNVSFSLLTLDSLIGASWSSLVDSI